MLAQIATVGDPQMAQAGMSAAGSIDPTVGAGMALGKMITYVLFGKGLEKEMRKTQITEAMVQANIGVKQAELDAKQTLVKLAKMRYYARRTFKFAGIAAVGFGVGYMIFRQNKQRA